MTIAAFVGFIRRFTLCFLLSAVATHPTVAAEIVLPIAAQYPWGYVGADGGTTGIAVELVRELGRRVGLAVRADLLPRRRMQIEQADNPTYNAAFLADTVSVPRQFEPVDVLLSYDVVAVSRRDQPAGSLADFAGRPVALVEALAVILPPMTLGGIRPVGVASLEEGLHLLRTGRADGVIEAQPMLRAATANLGVGFDQFSPLLPVMTIRSTFYVDRWGALAAQTAELKSAIEGMRRDGALRTIVNARYRPAM